MNSLRFPLILSILASVSTLGLKAAAWLLTGSVGLLSDTLESGINLIAALVAYYALWYSTRPADREHTYGHEKIAFFSSGLEGGLIIVAAIGIVVTAVERLLHPVSLHALGWGLAITGISVVINFAVAQLLLRTGRKHSSIILEADGHHLMTDVWTSLAVIAGIAVVALTSLNWLDPVIALVVAANITWTGFRLVRRSFHGLMDVALPEAELVRLRAAISSQLESGTTYHALRTRQGGSRLFADCHLLVPGRWSVQKGHDLGDRIEKAVHEAFPGLELTLHIEPIEARASWEDSEILGIERREEKGHKEASKTHKEER
ncbi:MAG TPA: cation diffusion facilitator family transporter [Gemmataceae bacterium]|jgi:cation diffusion facilitator family transporter|nr:cation diffusion facilitator family transporter [Gemmataceae bacterium]